jgi:hypothetical protein
MPASTTISSVSVASSDIVCAMNSSSGIACSASRLDKWQKILGSGATSQIVEISKFDGNYFDFEGSRIQVIKDIQGDTDQNTMLWIPGQRVLIAGDVLSMTSTSIPRRRMATPERNGQTR